MPIAQIKNREDSIISGNADPRQWKAELAMNIVTQYHGEIKARKAEAEEKKIHLGDAIPENTPVFKINQVSMNVVDLLCYCNAFTSKGEARRMILNGGVTINDKKVVEIV